MEIRDAFKNYRSKWCSDKEWLIDNYLNKYYENEEVGVISYERQIQGTRSGFKPASAARGMVVPLTRLEGQVAGALNLSCAAAVVAADQRGTQWNGQYHPL